MRNVVQKETPASRLRQARLTAGYAAAKAFATAHGIPQPTYAMHESGKRKLSWDVASRYADALDTTPSWLMQGEGEPPTASPVIPLPAFQISEMDVRAMAGPGGEPTRLDGASDAGDTWQVPSEFIRAQTTAGPADVRIIRIYGDSMAPMFQPGDRVLVDLSDTMPSPPGVFVLWDGLGIVVKRVEFIPYSEPKMVRLVSANQAYESYERPLETIHINGRVIAKWQWT